MIETSMSLEEATAYELVCDFNNSATEDDWLTFVSTGNWWCVSYGDWTIIDSEDNHPEYPDDGELGDAELKTAMRTFMAMEIGALGHRLSKLAAS